MSFADKNILSDLDIYISPHDRICLVGRNGSGKSSLMKIISGEYELDTGELFRDPSVKVGHLKQDLKNLPALSVYDYILQDIDAEEKSIKQYLADIILQQIHLDGNSILTEISGGQVRRALLAKALVSSPEILLLDEPTNHLDIASIEWLEGYLATYPGAVVCISHDRKFQENISNKVWWIDRGIIRKSSSGFRHYDEWREKILEIEEATLRKMSRKLEEEQQWLGTGVTARRKRNQKRLANLRRLREDFRAHQEHLRSAKAKLQLELSEEAKKTRFIIEAQGLTYQLPNQANKLLDNFNFQVKKGEKIGIIGPNGSGKSTLIRLLIKEIDPQSGSVKHGTNLEITYFDQYRVALNPEHSLRQIICPNGGDQVFLPDRTMHVAAYLKKFMFDPKIIGDKVSTLSGGEANRLLLAKSLINPGNFFVLDEPTNDLDMDSLEILLEILAEYNGTLLVVSHDRDFLERLVTRTLVFSESGIIDCFGGYEDYLKFYKKDAPAIIASKSTKSNNISNTKDDYKNKIEGAKPQKLSYKYARLLESLPLEITQLEQKIAEIENDLSDQDLFTKDHAKFAKLSEELADSNRLCQEKMELWIEVENMQASLK